MGLANKATPNTSSRDGGIGVQMRDVGKHFDGKVAVEEFSLDLSPGEFVSVIGPSGCGKSTTMLMAAGLLSPSRGEIFIDGAPQTGPITDVGIVFQDHLLLDFRTAFSNVMLQQQIRHLPKKEMESRAHALFGQLGLAHAKDRYPRQLSGGMRQRVSIARALVHDPSLLLMDEPFGALDAITRTQIRHELELLWLQRRMSVLFITHSIEEAIGLSDRVLVMSPTPGRLVEEIVIDLPRPRPAHLGHYEVFNEYAGKLYGAFERMGLYSFEK
ncbi:ABC transporter ATP-binding protein [Nitratireductor sp. StC3]|nr:ABC transporter ATP-binding protein [Nitratireductor sp. StC3]